MSKAKFRMVHTSFWNDPHVSEEMTVEDKYFFLYLLTNEHTTQIGVYAITKKQMAFELGYSIESVNALMQRFIDHHKLIRYNSETREIAIKNWGKYNLNKGGKPILDCVRSELKQVKDQSLISYVGERIENSSIKNLYDTYDESYNDTLPNRDGYEEKGLEGNSDAPSYDTSTSRTTIRGQKEQQEEQEQEEKQQQEKEQGESASPSSPDVVVLSPVDQEYKKLQDYCKEKMFFRKLTYEENLELSDLLDEFSDAQLIQAAVDIAIQNSKLFLAYARGILRRWKADGITNYQQLMLMQIGGQQSGKDQRQPGIAITDAEQRVRESNERLKKRIQS